MSAAPVVEATPRAVLAAAIERRRAAQARLGRAEAALARNSERWQEARRAETSAQAALAAAQDGNAGWLVDALLAERPPGPAPIAAARASLADAGAAAARCREADATLRGEIERERQTVALIEHRVAEAARSVLAESPAVLEAVARLEAAQIELIAAGDVVAWLAREQVLLVHRPAPGAPLLSGDSLLARAQRAHLRLEVPPQSWRDLGHHAVTSASWEAALRALEDDPDADI